MEVVVGKVCVIDASRFRVADPLIPVCVLWFLSWDLGSRTSLERHMTQSNNNCLSMFYI
jgi:hypothetical protein